MTYTADESSSPFKRFLTISMTDKLLSRVTSQCRYPHPNTLITHLGAQNLPYVSSHFSTSRVNFDVSRRRLALFPAPLCPRKQPHLFGCKPMPGDCFHQRLTEIKPDTWNERGLIESREHSNQTYAWGHGQAV